MEVSAGFEAALSAHSVTLPWAARPSSIPAAAHGHQALRPSAPQSSPACPLRGLSVCLPRTVWQMNLEPRYPPASTEHAA